MSIKWLSVSRRHLTPPPQGSCFRCGVKWNRNLKADDWLWHVQRSGRKLYLPAISRLFSWYFVSSTYGIEDMYGVWILRYVHSRNKYDLPRWSIVNIIYRNIEIYTKKVKYWQQGSSHLPKIHRWAHCPQIQTVERHFSWSRWSQWSKWNPSQNSPSTVHMWLVVGTSRRE